MSVTVIVSFQAKADKIDALLEFLTNLQPKVIEAGCHRISVLQDQNQPLRVFEIEEWESTEAHQHMVKQAQESGAFDPFTELLDGSFEVYYLNTVHSTQA